MVRDASIGHRITDQLPTARVTVTQSKGEKPVGLDVGASGLPEVPRVTGGWLHPESMILRKAPLARVKVRKVPTLAGTLG